MKGILSDIDGPTVMDGFVVAVFRRGKKLRPLLNHSRIKVKVMGNKNININSCIFCNKNGNGLSIYPTGSNQVGICFDCAIRALKALVEKSMSSDLASVNSEMEGLLLHQAVFDLNEGDHERLSVLREKVEQYKSEVKSKITMQLFESN